MDYLDRYINKFCDKQLESKYSDENDIIIVIPSYDESLETIEDTLNSIDIAYQNKGDVRIHIMVLVNFKKSDEILIKEQSSQLYNELISKSYGFSMDVFQLEFLDTKGGVGLARKCLMDCALRKFDAQGKMGLIINLDADTLVSSNYFTSIANYFSQNENIEAASISFEHRIHEDEKINRAIVDYELHLRYYINMQRLCGLPFAFQTVGSAMVVRSDAYAKEGGMPKKQAGEDFYFLHKYSKNNTLGEINTATVYPSSRLSHRVPFGTGKAVWDIIDSDHDYTSYSYVSFEILAQWINLVFNSYEKLQYGVDSCLSIDNDHFKGFLDSFSVNNKVSDILRNTTTKETFTKRFFQWFDAFMLMKYLHFMRESKYKDFPINDCIDYLFNKLDLPRGDTKYDNLLMLRKYDLQLLNRD